MRTRIRELRAVLPPVFWTVWWGTLINRAGAFVVPVLTFYLTDKRGMSLVVAGMVVSAFGAGGIFASLVGGMLADRLGRRATMALSLYGGATLMVALSQVETPVAIAVVTFSYGFVGDLYRPAVSAFVADVVPSEHRQSAYGILYWAINIGFSIAPVAAGVVATFSYRALFLGDAATSAIFATIILLRVPESHPDPSKMKQSNGGLGAVLRDRVFVWFWICALLQSLVMFQMVTPLSGWMESQGFGPGAYGGIIAINGILIVLTQPFLNEWTKRFQRRTVLVASALFMGVGMSLHGASASLWLHGTAVALWTMGEILLTPVASAFVADRAPPLLRGRYQGMFAVAWGIAGCSAPIFGPRILAFDPAVLWIGCLVVGVLAALGYRSMRST